MKRLCVFIIGLVLLMPAFANLSLKDLESILSSNNFASAELLLMGKNYLFEESENVPHSEQREKVFSWGHYDSTSRSLDSYLSLTIENDGNGAVNYLTLVLTERDNYFALLSQQGELGYMFLETNSVHRDSGEEQEVVYSNSKYVLITTTLISESSLMWRVEIYKRGYRCDIYNGKKIDLHDNGETRVSYTITNGRLDSKYYSNISSSVEPFVIISPNEDKWEYKVYNLDGILIFNGTSPRKEINMTKHNDIEGYGTTKKFIDGECVTTIGRVALTISPLVMSDCGVIELYVKVTPQ